MEKVISEQRRKDLEAAIKLYLDGYCSKSFEISGKFTEYASFYHLTNESVETFLKIVTLTLETKALSILASGDQVFHLVQRGLKDIDTFDINRLTEYYALGFKKRAIECLSFEDYNKLFEYYKEYYDKTHNCQHLDIEQYVIENMEDEYKWFWQELFYNLKQHGFNPSVFHFANRADRLSSICRIPNSYMKDIEKYNELQQKLAKANITFKQSSIVDVPNNFNKKYDLIYLSNVMEYYTEFFCGNKKKALDILKKIYNENLNINGEILLIDLVDRFMSVMLEDKFLREHKYIMGRESTMGYTLKKEK